MTQTLTLDDRIALLEDRERKLLQALPYVEMTHDAELLQRRLVNTRQRLAKLRKARGRV